MITTEMAEENPKTGEGEQEITPWKAQAAKGKATIDYDKLIGKNAGHAVANFNTCVAVIIILCEISVLTVVQFGSERIDAELLARIEKATGKPVHHFLRRGIFFSHRSVHENFIRESSLYND